MHHLHYLEKTRSPNQYFGNGHVQKYGGSFDQNSKTLKMAKNHFFCHIFIDFKKIDSKF